MRGLDEQAQAALVTLSEYIAGRLAGRFRGDYILRGYKSVSGAEPYSVLSASIGETETAKRVGAIDARPAAANRSRVI